MRFLVQAVILASLMGITACKNGAGVADVDVNGEPIPDTAPASGLSITKITLNQGVQLTLMEDGVQGDNTARVVEGRPGLLRVFVERDADFESRDIVGVLHIDDDVHQFTRNVDEDSNNSKRGTTLNFVLDSDDIRDGRQWYVELLEATEGQYSGSDTGSRYPDEGTSEMNVAPNGDVTLVIIPVRYNGDGSGRLPDTSDAQIQRIKDSVNGMFPHANVTVTVDDAINFGQQIQPGGQGWDTLLYRISGMRSTANVPENTYYYGLFQPTNSLASFCGGGCILGLSNLPGVNDTWGRASIGLGYSGTTAVNTLVHEVGHAQGREHSDCGLYGQPSDRSYPYSDAKLGVIGYDYIDDSLRPIADYRDVMSYCEPYWISDYTYHELFKRRRDLQDRREAPLDLGSWSLFRVEADGQLTPHGELELDRWPTGKAVGLALRDGLGRAIGETEAYFLPLSHLDGGTLIVPSDEVVDAHTVALLDE